MQTKRTLSQYLNFVNKGTGQYEPQLFDLSKPQDQRALKILFQKKKIVQVVDDHQAQLNEMYFVRYPKKLRLEHEHQTVRTVKRVSVKEGMWIYYPWRQSLVHIMKKSQYTRLRLSRNQNLISKSEQSILAKSKIAIAGLNVGNPAAIAMALEGVGKEFSLADPDILSVSNLNRFRAGISDLGVNKAVLTARQMYETNPYLKIFVHDNGVVLGESKSFLLKPRADILIEETDNLSLKIELRQNAKEFEIPVIMVTGNGPNLILDVERYDIRPALPILNGTLRQSIKNRISRLETVEYTFDQKVMLARDFIGSKWLTKELRQSFRQVGKTLAGIPQLSETSFLRGAVLCYAARKVLLEQRLPSGRYVISLDTIIS